MSFPENVWGRDQTMVLSAVRYCLGRMTYIVGDCADWIIEMWTHFDDNTKSLIQRDIEDAFERGGMALGMDCDREEWERVRALWESPKTDLGFWPDGLER